MHGTVQLFDCRLDATAVEALNPVFASGALAAGPFVSELEARLCRYLKCSEAVAVSDMTHALAIALRIAGIGPGDEVLTLAVNCMSSNSAIAIVGATPVWVDIDPLTLTIDLADCARAVTARTKALIVYHVAGYPADPAAIEEFCRSHGIVHIEDANCALGAKAGKLPIGNGGRFSVLSFYPNRQVNGIEGAALICADPEDAVRARLLRRFGIDTTRFRDASGEIAIETDVPEIGFSASMSNVNAALACHQLDSLDKRLAVNTANAAELSAALAAMPDLSVVEWRDMDRPAFWVFFVHAARRDSLMLHLKARGVQCSKLHQRNDQYHGFGAQSRELPGTDRFEREMLALPVGWWLQTDQLTMLIDALGAWQPGVG